MRLTTVARATASPRTRSRRGIVTSTATDGTPRDDGDIDARESNPEGEGRRRTATACASPGLAVQPNRYLERPRHQRGAGHEQRGGDDPRGGGGRQTKVGAMTHPHARPGHGEQGRD